MIIRPINRVSPSLTTVPVDLSQTTVLLVGAAGRLGRVLAEHLARAGATVAIADREKIQTFNHQYVYTVDATSEAEVERLFAEVESDLGPLDAVVHAVGMWDGKPLVDTSLEDFENVMRINLTSAFLCFREATKSFIRSGRPGRMVAVASRQGVSGGVAQQAAYSASKAGIVRLVEATAQELASSGIAASAVAPSMILFGDEPPGTIGVSVEQVAQMCTYLASLPGAIHTGTVVAAYGGPVTRDNG